MKQKINKKNVVLNLKLVGQICRESFNVSML